MEPLGQTGATGESIKEDAVVASIRSAMKELQESIQELCKASLSKIITLGQYFSSFFFSISLLFSLSDSQNLPFLCSE